MCPEDEYNNWLFFPLSSPNSGLKKIMVLQFIIHGRLQSVKTVMNINETSVGRLDVMNTACEST